MNDPTSKILADAITKRIYASTAHINLPRDYIVITEDRTYRCLRMWKDNFETRRAWLVPVCLAVSLGLTFVTSTFKDALGMSKEVWQSFFLLSLLASIVWSACEIGRSVYSKFFSKAPDASVEGLIQQLKLGADVVDMPTEAEKRDVS